MPYLRDSGSFKEIKLALFGLLKLMSLMTSTTKRAIE
jgi:hypothetical protein